MKKREKTKCVKRNPEDDAMSFKLQIVQESLHTNNDLKPYYRNYVLTKNQIHYQNYIKMKT